MINEVLRDWISIIHPVKGMENRSIEMGHTWSYIYGVLVTGNVKAQLVTYLSDMVVVEVKTILLSSMYDCPLLALTMSFTSLRTLGFLEFWEYLDLCDRLNNLVDFWSLTVSASREKIHWHSKIDNFEIHRFLLMCIFISGDCDSVRLFCYFSWLVQCLVQLWQYSSESLQHGVWVK